LFVAIKFNYSGKEDGVFQPPGLWNYLLSLTDGDPGLFIFRAHSKTYFLSHFPRRNLCTEFELSVMENFWHVCFSWSESS